jgi:hypothetical protein
MSRHKALCFLSGREITYLDSNSLIIDFTIKLKAKADPTQIFFKIPAKILQKLQRIARAATIFLYVSQDLTIILQDLCQDSFEFL